MSDPFADGEAASPELIEIITTALEVRAADPAMLPVIDACLDRLDPTDGGLIVDIGCGTGGVTRRIADRFVGANVLGVVPSAALTDKARALAGDYPNLEFRIGDGAALDLEDDSVGISRPRDDGWRSDIVLSCGSRTAKWSKGAIITTAPASHGNSGWSNENPHP